MDGDNSHRCIMPAQSSGMTLLLLPQGLLRNLLCVTAWRCDVLCSSDTDAAGEASIQQANEKRFQDRVQQLFKQFKEQRLTNAALECEQLINRGTQQLTEVKF